MIFFTIGIPTSNGFSVINLLKSSMVYLLCNSSQISPPVPVQPSLGTTADFLHPQYSLPTIVLWLPNPLPDKPPSVTGLNLHVAVFVFYPQFFCLKSWWIVYSPALSHHAAFDLRDLYFCLLLFQAEKASLLLWQELFHAFGIAPVSPSDPSYSPSWRGLKDGMSSDVGEPRS